MLTEEERRLRDEAKSLSPELAPTHVGGRLLENAGIDPIVLLKEQLDEINQEIERERGSEAPRVQQLEKLNALKFRILDILLPYQVGKAPTTTIHQVENASPLQFVLYREGQDEEESSNETPDD